MRSWGCLHSKMRFRHEIRSRKGFPTGKVGYVRGLTVVDADRDVLTITKLAALCFRTHGLVI